VISAIAVVWVWMGRAGGVRCAATCSGLVVLWGVVAVRLARRVCLCACFAAVYCQDDCSGGG
jgi:hypothetical protein